MEAMYCDKEREHAAAVQRVKEEIMSSEDVTKMCGVFRVLSDPTRMKLVLALMKGEMCVYHLAEVVGGTVSGISHQLRILRENNVVKAKRYGKNVEYSIADQHIMEMVKMAITHAACGR